MLDSATVFLTASACDYAQAQLRANPQALGLRIQIKKTGCSGYAYDIQLAETQAPDDQVYEQKDALKIFVDPTSWSFFDRGLTVDYVTKGLNHQWKFENPKEAGSCGCGESFSV